jgi:hypothetical protein
MKYFFYVFYRYYKSGSWESVPYFSAITTFLFTLFLYIVAAIIFLYPKIQLFTQGNNWLIILSLLILGVILRVSITPKSLEDPELEKRYDTSHGFLACIYVIWGVVFFIIATLYNKVHIEH